MSSALSESPLTQLLPTLWRCRPSSTEDVRIGVHVPYTVIYEHNFPKGLFNTNNEGYLQRRIGKEIDSKTVVDVFGVGPLGPKQKREMAMHAGNPEKCSRTIDHAEDIVAVYVEKRLDSQQFSVQFFTDAGLRAFLLGSAVKKRDQDSSDVLGPNTSRGQQSGGDSRGLDENDPAVSDIRLVQNKNGILQKFVYPLGYHNELIQVVWTPHVCIAEKQRSLVFMADTTKTPFQRAATFHAPPAYSNRAYVAPHLTETIRAQCESLVDQLYVVEHKLVEQLTLYFKVDEREKLWLLWCPSVRFSTAGIHRPVGRGGLSRGRGHSSSGQRKPDILPDFAIPPSLESEQSKNPLFLKQKTWIRPTSSSKSSGIGLSAKDRKAADFRVASSTTFIEVNEDSALDLEEPRMHLKCLNQRESDVPLPTNSRLFLKPKWIQGQLKLNRPASTSTHSRLHLHLAAAGSQPRDREDGSVRSGGSRSERGSPKGSPRPLSPSVSRIEKSTSRSSAQNMRSGLPPRSSSGARSPQGQQAQPQSSAGPESHRSGPDSVLEPYEEKVYTMADFPSFKAKQEATTIELAQGTRNRPQKTFDAADDLSQGDFAVEQAMVWQLTRSLIHPSITDEAVREQLTELNETIELAVTFLQAVRDELYRRSLLFPVEEYPMTFSVPVFLFSDAEVREALLEFLGKCGFEGTDIRTAVMLDRAVDRTGVMDELSHHHANYDPNRVGSQADDGKLPCFQTDKRTVLLTMSSRMTPFFVVTLRNLHALAESRAVANSRK